MNLELTVHHFDLTDTVRDYVDRKVGRLERYLPDARSTRVDLDRGVRRSQGEVYTAQVTTWVDSTILRVEEMNVDLFAAIDLAADRLQRQMERYKGKRLHRWHEGGKTDLLALEIDEADEAEESSVTVVRRKRFLLHPMTEGEAAEQLTLLEHDFFLYVDADTGLVNVLYRRRDGSLGLIESERA